MVEEHDSSQPCLHGEVVTISTTSYAITVLTYEGVKVPSMSIRKSSAPVYAHHVVLCPLLPLTITTTFTTPYSPPTSWMKLSKLSSGQRCFVSGTVLPSLQLETFLSEIKYRRKYGPIAYLHWKMLATKCIPQPVQWRLMLESSYTTQRPMTVPELHYSLPRNTVSAIDIDVLASQYYMDKLTDIIAQICKEKEPIVIDWTDNVHMLTCSPTFFYLYVRQINLKLQVNTETLSV